MTYFGLLSENYYANSRDGHGEAFRNFGEIQITDQRWI